MKPSFLASGDAYANAFLADGFLDAHYRFSTSGQLAPGDARWFEGALDFLENARYGFLLTLASDEARKLAKAWGKSQPPISGRRKFTSAFKMAMAAWTSETWATKQPGFQITKVSINQELGLYITAIKQALEPQKAPPDIKDLPRTRDFFVELGKAALAADVDKDLVPLSLGVMAKS